MGIPSYFVHIVKVHSTIIKKFQRKDIHIHNLYIDSNSIIYDGIKVIEYKNNDEIFEEKLIEWVCEKIFNYIQLIVPTQKVLIAFDGVAPVAKLEQQRNRRYKTWYTNNYVAIHKTNTNLENNTNSEKKWDTSAITPGTKFMDKLYNGVIKYFNNKYKLQNNLEIIISGSNEFGEGEHKI